MTATTATATPAEVWAGLADSLDSMSDVELVAYRAADQAASKAVEGLDLPTFSPEWFRAFSEEHTRLLG